MKKFPKILQADSRGQIVIPKDVRRELGIDEGTGFFAYLIANEGIFLKKIESKTLSDHEEIKELKDKATAVGMKKAHIEQAEKTYKKQNKGGFEEL